MNKTLIILGIGLAGIIGAVVYFTKSSQITSKTSVTVTPGIPANDQNKILQFTNPKRSAHHETNTPQHGAVLAGVPVNIVIDFNFDLAPPSEIMIKKGDINFGTGDTVIGSNKLSMRRKMDPSSPDGLYTVSYNACWPDGSCDEGNFQFLIDGKKLEGYINMRDQKEVEVKLSQISFIPQKIKIKKGTQVTWINEDEVDHFVNTDSHPAHTYFPAQNSKALKKGDKFSLTFDTPGLYPYHCSAHTEMRASILVE